MLAIIKKSKIAWFSKSKFLISLKLKNKDGYFYFKNMKFWFVQKLEKIRLNCDKILKLEFEVEKHTNRNNMPQKSLVPGGVDGWMDGRKKKLV